MPSRSNTKKPSEFDALLESELADPLCSRGFVRVGKTRFLHQEGYTVLLLLAQWFRGTFNGLTVCVGHTFLHDLERKLVDFAHVEPSSLPFKEDVVSLQNGFLERWYYVPRNLGVWGCDDPAVHERFYEKAVPGRSERAAVAHALARVVRAIDEVALPWSRILSPDEALQQLLEHGENAYCERIWIADYRAHRRAVKHRS